MELFHIFVSYKNHVLMNRIAIVLAIAATCLGAYSCKSSGDGQKGAGIEVGARLVVEALFFVEGAEGVEPRLVF